MNDRNAIMKLLAIFCASFTYFISVISQTTITPNTNNDTVLNPDASYCFEFTWIGPGYDENYMYNGTCTDYLDETRAKHVPCSPPIVVSDDGTFPDIDWMFENKKTSVLCRRTANQVCATYTYKYDGVVNNATYMCTKVQQIGGSAITSGCYTQTIAGYEVELCVCKSNPGLWKPCNGNF
ncbi:uncharacterized protein LOC123005537 [Tribolium madens]|uniref:uncharacterized protein LOC123005537 n=1 Tax=Tribolium madens TaxID=41895 RepID=UPI001CF75A7C|nr:uncharacterized protein LOC123005537 [Tribolium madens]